MHSLETAKDLSLAFSKDVHIIINPNLTTSNYDFNSWKDVKLLTCFFLQFLLHPRLTYSSTWLTNQL